jgi:hypothetical protein
MMRSILAGMLLFGAAGMAAAQDEVPDFTGKWTGEFEVILMPRAGGEGKVEKATVTYNLANQEGRVIWGEVSSDKTEGTRPLVLAFSMNNGTLLGSDSHATHRITVISPNRMEACFGDNGGDSIFASCGVLQKAP